MQIFCVIPHPHASNYGFMTGSYLPLVERFFLDGLIVAHRLPIGILSLSCVCLFCGGGQVFDLFGNHSVTTLMFTDAPIKNPHKRFFFRLCGYFVIATKTFYSWLYTQHFHLLEKFESSSLVPWSFTFLPLSRSSIQGNYTSHTGDRGGSPCPYWRDG